MIKKTAVTLHPENPKWRLKLTKWVVGATAIIFGTHFGILSYGVNPPESICIGR